MVKEIGIWEIRMAKEKKSEIIRNLEDLLTRSSVAIITEYRGLDAA